MSVFPHSQQINYFLLPRLCPFYISSSESPYSVTHTPVFHLLFHLVCIVVYSVCIVKVYSVHNNYKVSQSEDVLKSPLQTPPMTCALGTSLSTNLSQTPIDFSSQQPSAQTKSYTPPLTVLGNFPQLKLSINPTFLQACVI